VKVKFSKHNWVKSDCKSKLKFKTLDALMLVPLCEKEVEAMDWPNNFDVWGGMKNHKVVILSRNSN
jgi:hypothetical protein